jgi:hypothetical protein
MGIMEDNMNLENLKKYGRLQMQYDYENYLDSLSRHGYEDEEPMNFDEFCRVEGVTEYGTGSRKAETGS